LLCHNKGRSVKCLGAVTKRARLLLLFWFTAPYAASMKQQSVPLFHGAVTGNLYLPQIPKEQGFYCSFGLRHLMPLKEINWPCYFYNGL